MSMESKRLLMEFEQEVKTINRQIINPTIDVLEINSLRPVLELVANARGEYLKAFFAAGANTSNELNIENFGELRQKREVFEELLQASYALQMAIEKEYLDVSTSFLDHLCTNSAD